MAKHEDEAHADDRHAHHRADAGALRVGVLTVSDSRALDSDVTGRVVAEHLEAAQHTVVWRELVRDDIEAIRGAVRTAIAGHALDVLIVNGGTGIAPHDVTPEALEPMLDLVLAGFGEQLRALSYAEVGPRGLLSRAFAGVIGETLLFALPGSPAACKTAMSALVLPLVGHAVGLVRPRRATSS